MTAETLGFQTEVKELMHLVVHALYSNKEIFLRELVSNASDANDKLRFAALDKPDLLGDDKDLKIWVSFDDKAKTITVRDNGIGMSRDDVIAHLGTIAKSGTKEFLSQLTGDEAKDSHLIGQFGVGFYSAFIIADRVVVKSRKAGEREGVQWTSEGQGEYTVDNISKPDRGTEVTLFVKDSETEFLSHWKLKEIITKYSDHISWSILMKTEEDESKEEPKDEVVNRAKALWTLSKSEIKDEEYQALYKHISHDFNDPMTWGHNHVEGKLQYISLLYIPSQAPFDLFQPEAKHGLKLFVKRVFIMDEAEQFLPKYLRFVKGIIDSSDLPLNVSRELLQENKITESIRKACIKRVLGMLSKMAENKPEDYQKFWSQFGQVLKEGPIEDFSNKDDVAKLLRFATTKSDSAEQTVSLADYVSRMPEDQDKIYYITAQSYNAAKNSPHLEVFKQKGIEVLLLSDRIDGWLVSHLSDFDGKHLQSVTKGKLDPEAEEPKPTETQASVLDHMKEVLGEKVKEVRTTQRLTTSPACLVADDHDMGMEMQRILKMAGQEVPNIQPILELNPEHSLIKRLESETDDEQFGEWTTFLFDQALLAEGGQLDDPGAFVARMNKLLLSA